jgi:RNA polymerase sigma-54 factor
MPQGLHLSQRLTQSLVLAPQLQQSLALLQAPTLELKALVEQELQQNPVLEEAAAPETDLQEKEVRDGEEPAEVSDPAEPPADLDFDPTSEKAAAEPVDDFQAEFERLVQLDQEWRDHFAQTNLPMRASAEEEEKRQFMFDSLVAGTSLQELLLEQVRESSLSSEQWPIAEMLIGNIDKYGYLKGAWTFSAEDFTDFPEFIRLLKDRERQFDAWLVGQLSEPTREALRNYLGQDDSVLKPALLGDLNATVRGPSIHDPQRFGGIPLRSETQQLLSQHPEGDDLRRLNRLLLEDAYPSELSRNHLKAVVDGLAASVGLPSEQVEAVLKVIQTFEPPGVGARDLRECLLLQMTRAGQQETLEYRIVSDFMEALGKRRIPEIARGTGTNVDDVQEALARIARLEPRPGRAYLPDNDQYILPEVFVRRSGDDYAVTTNNEHIPHLRISNTYKDLMAQGSNSAEVRNYIREKIRAGKFLIKSLHQRQQTILNIAKEIVHRQRDFMAKGVAHLKPLTMVKVAEVVGVHETTVSRAVSGKYMQTPQGIFEMKYFFTAGIQTASGDGMSNTSVKDMIADIFKAENTGKPLSDQEVVRMLKEKGIVIARRTVAKYRAELNILPSNLRKVY